MSVDAMIELIHAVATAHRETQILLETCGEFVAAGIKKNIDEGRNASENLPEMAPKYIAGQDFTPLAPLTLAIRKTFGRMGEDPLKDTGHMYRHIGPHDATPTSVKVGGTDTRATVRLWYNFGTDVTGIAGSASPPDKEYIIPPRVPIGYTKKVEGAIFSFWQKALRCGDATHGSMKMEIEI